MTHKQNKTKQRKIKNKDSQTTNEKLLKTRKQHSLCSMPADILCTLQN
jgi:hypothetical protein